MCVGVMLKILEFIENSGIEFFEQESDFGRFHFVNNDWLLCET